MLRITGGSLRGRRIAAPKGRTTRPTSEKVRESIFDSLENLAAMQGSFVLDLFAGSGALGIEALSRGAAEVIFVEGHARTAAVIRANLEQLAPVGGEWQVVRAPVASWLRSFRPVKPADLVLLDPPYGAGLAEQALQLLASAEGVSQAATIVLEAPARNPPIIPADLEVARQKSYGDTQVIYITKRR